MSVASRAAMALGALALVTAELPAQPSLSLSAGVSVPLSTAARVYELGYNATAGIGIKPLFTPIGVRAEVLYNEFQLKQNPNNVARTIAALFNATFSSQLTTAPRGYVIAGVALYNTVTTNLSTSWNTDFGFNAGAGLDLPFRVIRPFFEARYYLINTEGDAVKFVPIVVGIRF